MVYFSCGVPQLVCAPSVSVNYPLSVLIVNI